MNHQKSNWNARKSAVRNRRNVRRRKKHKLVQQRQKKSVRHKRLYSRRESLSEQRQRGFNRPYQRLRTKFPQVLDFVGNIGETIAFFTEFKNVTVLNPADEVLLDLSQLKTISPDAALVLIAEATRAADFGCKLHGSRASEPLVDRMLWDIGYYSYYGFSGGMAPRSAGKIFLMHQTGNRVDPQIAKALVEKFVPVASLNDAEMKALYDALVECMSNVLQHAYPKRGLKENHLENQWWLLGTMSPSSHEISFCFYDQGVGIPNTIRTRWQHKVPGVSWLSENDNQLLQRAVMEGLSSTKQETRGKGLPTLKSFIDQYKNGHMTIVTHKSKCIFYATLLNQFIASIP